MGNRCCGRDGGVHRAIARHDMHGALEHLVSQRIAGTTNIECYRFPYLGVSCALVCGDVNQVVCDALSLFAENAVEGQNRTPHQGSQNKFHWHNGCEVDGIPDYPVEGWDAGICL